MFKRTTARTFRHACRLATGRTSCQTVAMVAWIALVVSAFAALTALYGTIRDRPRLGVIVRRDVSSNGLPMVEWHITVINYGRHPQTISSVDLVSKNSPFSTSVAMLRRIDYQVDGPDLPATVEPFSFLDWAIPPEVMRKLFSGSGQEFRPFLDKYITVSHNVRFNKMIETYRFRRSRAIAPVREYQSGYLRM
jgi:hypothetical protein